MGIYPKILMLNSLFEKHIFDDKTQLYYIIMDIPSETSVSIIYVFILCYLSFFDIRILITTLVSSNLLWRQSYFLYFISIKKNWIYTLIVNIHTIMITKWHFFLFNLPFKMIRYTSFNNRLTLVFVVV